MLQPIVQASSSVPQDTSDVVRNIQDLNVSGGVHAIASSDIESLYPTIDQARAQIAVRIEATKWHENHNHKLADLSREVLRYI